jgi:hypothetical protein
VPDDHIRPIKDPHSCFVLFPLQTWNSLDSKVWRSGNVDAVQQIPQSAGRDRGFTSRGLYPIGMMIHLLLFRITQGSVILIVFVFILVVFFFISLMVIVVVPIVVIILWQLLSFCRSSWSVFPRKYHDHDIKGVLLRNVLRTVVLRLLLRRHISWCHLTKG